MTTDKPSRPCKSPLKTALHAVEAMPRLTPPRWSCNHHSYGSDIEAFIEATQSLEIVAQTRQTKFIDARANAELIVRAVNEQDLLKKLVIDMIGALEMCLKSEGLTWEAEQEADIVCARAKAAVGVK